MVGDIKVVDVIGSFGSSKEALGYAERNTVEFAILDTEMPEMDGVELGKALKNIYPGIVLIYTTKKCERLVEILKMKADYCIIKPYDKYDIEDAAERAILLCRRQKKRLRAQMFGRFDVFLDESFANTAVISGKNHFVKSKEHSLSLFSFSCIGFIKSSSKL